jgi:hypothetical protein
MNPKSVSTLKFMIGAALGGGLGVPVFFIALGHAIRGTLASNSNLLLDVMEWFESFRVMLWPSSLLIVARAPGDTVGELSDLLIAVLINIGVYALLGLASALACRHPVAEILLVVAVVLLAYGVNVFWSNHLASFMITAAIIVAVFVALFRKYRAKASPV